MTALKYHNAFRFKMIFVKEIEIMWYVDMMALCNLYAAQVQRQLLQLLLHKNQYQLALVQEVIIIFVYLATSWLL